MSFLNGIITDLREKRLWPIALALVLALVAVPVLLAKPAPKVPAVATAPGAGSAASHGTALPVVTESGTASQSRLNGHGRDPFAQPKVGSAAGASGTTTTTATTTGGAGGGGSTASGGSTAKGGTGGTTTTTPTTTTSTTTTTTTTPTVPPTPTGLTDTQSYHVSLSITNSRGGLDKIDPLERLSLLPSDRQPLLIELGVLNGGHQVLFVVQPRTVVRGPGTCTPGPIDCEILSLAKGQIESVSKPSSSGVVASALLAVTAIKTDAHSSAAAADKARQQTSAAGRRLLSKSSLGALSLFQYKTNLGAVLDLRDLTVGGF